MLLSLLSLSLSPCRQNLKREGFRGLTNPYCQLNVGRQGPYTTDVVFDSANPSWEHKRQTFEFRVSAVYGGTWECLNLPYSNSTYRVLTAASQGNNMSATLQLLWIVNRYYWGDFGCSYCCARRRRHMGDFMI